jgi:hypothetical protein
MDVGVIIVAGRGLHSQRLLAHACDRCSNLLVHYEVIHRHVVGDYATFDGPACCFPRAPWSFHAAQTLTNRGEMRLFESYEVVGQLPKVTFDRVGESEHLLPGDECT